MDPLLVASRFSEAVDTILRDLNPFAGADFGANCGLEFAEFAEDAHVDPCPCTPSSSDFHFRNIGWNEQVRLRHGHHFSYGYPGRGLLQRYFSTGKTDHGHVGDDQIDRPGG